MSILDTCLLWSCSGEALLIALEWWGGWVGGLGGGVGGAGSVEFCGLGSSVVRFIAGI